MPFLLILRSGIFDHKIYFGSFLVDSANNVFKMIVLIYAHQKKYIISCSISLLTFGILSLFIHYNVCVCMCSHTLLIYIS